MIVGAPKCGTTSLYSYLSGHPGVFASPIKEPNFFCLDTPALRVVSRWSDYEGLFRAAGPDQLRLEASTAYLLSPVAVPAILEANSRAKIIVAVRDPIEMIVSYHAQKLYAFEEDQVDFGLAWELSGYRARGERVAARCRAPAYLDYKSVARLGGQVARMVRIVPPDQLHVILFDDLSRDAERTYGAVLDFLALAPDGRNDFAIANPRKTHAWPALSRLDRQAAALAPELQATGPAGLPTVEQGRGSCSSMACCSGPRTRTDHRAGAAPAAGQRAASRHRETRPIA